MLRVCMYDEEIFMDFVDYGAIIVYEIWKHDSSASRHILLKGASRNEMDANTGKLSLTVSIINHLLPDVSQITKIIINPNWRGWLVLLVPCRPDIPTHKIKSRTCIYALQLRHYHVAGGARPRLRAMVDSDVTTYHAALDSITLLGRASALLCNLWHRTSPLC
jgi:hypothetical protein